MKEKSVDSYPTILNSFLLSLKLIFFNEKALVRLIIDKRHIYNLFTIFLLMFLIPIKGIDGNINYSLDTMLQGIFISLFFIIFLFFVSPNKKIGLGGFFRVFFAFEVVDIFVPLSFLIPDRYVIYFYAVHIGWYLSLSVFFFSRLNKLNYVISTALVFSVFLLVNILSASL